MDLAEVFVFDLGWAFFAAWGMILATLSLIAFGRDLLPSKARANREQARR
ncbi:MAG: hypothetical protein WAL89_13410 [Candidatus Sulfotelmatobacter sp.]|jgi:hypothetical protein